ncbi:LacI family DNA-binding transcriptional regulator [Roseibium marinum]|uniref:DNA-binding LacI/PurR family transcriptional regulator n=1 Tax=Roseibium marinum TaxID=281252 RepID=A0A2S3UKF0_9HYPH|nr:LacI family DNA-binding transcriptional regulator [Roseibium marinum]POF27969.1 DNA-binding LacI/PurR family transcriptional regulator [Roseibium marinum]
MSGKRQRQNRSIRLEEIAKRCGVSVSTASRALNGTAGVRPELREAIISAARELNYAIPPAVAGRKVILAASSVAMVDYARNQFTYYVLDGLKERAAALGIEIVTRPVSTQQDETALLEEAGADETVVGCLFLSLDDAGILERTEAFEKPIVLVNGDDPLMRRSSVTPCNRSAGRLACTHLLGLGHRRILFLSHRGRRTIERRLEGWRDALTAAGVEDIDGMVVEVGDWLPEEAGNVIRKRLEEKGADFTAILAAGDALALGAAQTLIDAGYKVPEDISVCGMDDLPLAAFSAPPLTTMHIPMREIGSTALTLLLDDMAQAGLPRRVELACRLIERDSCAPLSRRQNVTGAADSI